MTGCPFAASATASTATTRASERLPAMRANSFATVVSFVLPLEAEVLECLRGTAVERCRSAIVLAALGQVSLRDPGGGAVRGGRELRECIFRLGQRRLGLVEPPLLEQRAPEHEPRVAELVDAILASFQAPERTP